jgi:hypothetical protein
VTVSSSANIDKVNCRAASDSAYVKVVGVGKLADIRVDVCPSISRPIRLSQFLDSLAYNTISWTKVNPASPAINPQTGEINSANLNGTYTYRYSQTSNCGTSSAIAYVHPLKNRFPRHNDTIAICKDEKRSREIQINRILGLELDGGTWMYDNTVLSSYIKAFPASSSYSGALVFDAYLAWTNTAAGYNKFNYRGDVNAKYFVFQYTALAGNCIDNLNKEIVIVVTEKAY